MMMLMKLFMILMMVVVMVMLLLSAMKLQQHWITVNIQTPHRHHGRRINVALHRTLLLRILRLLLMLLLLVLLLADGELMQDKPQFSLAVLDLALELSHDPVTPANRVAGSNVGLDYDCTHRLVLLCFRREILYDLGDLPHPKQLVRVEELALAVVWEIRGQDAVRGALPALVLARRASRARPVAAVVVAAADDSVLDDVGFVVAGVACG
ncbi:unnamed protein product [Linum tenue]|uniref:Secreted protein n=1 Tax=Linum tenue TaxID=586396 RepID=A0AAV0KF18_9ROSI|nr:unnamed protein product [Linum tenue]